MAYHYDIQFGAVHYTPVGLVDTNAKVVWDKGDNGLNYRKRIDGSFTLLRSDNESLYDAIYAMTHCAPWYISVLDQNDNLVVKSAFNKRDIEYNVDKCNMVIKPRFYDPNSIDALINKDFNILTSDLDVYAVSYNGAYQFEFIECTSTNVTVPDLQWNATGSFWFSTVPMEIPVLKVFCGQGQYTTYNTQAGGWTWYAQHNVYSGADPVTESIFDITTTWFREIKLTAYSLDPSHASPPPTGGSGYAFVFLGVYAINGVNYNKWTRYVSDCVPLDLIADGNPALNNAAGILFSLTDYYGSPLNGTYMRTINRARRLNDVLEYFATQFGCVLSSEFFTNNVNPISLFDLTNIMIAQKSDCKFDAGVEPSDPATIGIITFKQLMEQLWAMFQVSWVIEDNVLYVEHINYFRFNFSYTQNLVPGLDLTVVYPICLSGSISYAFEQNIPIRMKFNFMEAWNIDFVGTDIDYSSCLQDGSTETIAAELFTTDLDPTYLDNVASNDGFVLFHCEEIASIIVGYYAYVVYSQVGEISGVASPNAHFSWANLHLYYWTRNSYLSTGRFNNKDINFLPPHKYLRKQRPIEFPFCVENFDDIVNQTIRTTMGDGEIEKAEYSFKTGNIKLELSYE